MSSKKLGPLFFIGILVIILSMVVGVGLSILFAVVRWWTPGWAHIGISVVVAILGLACFAGQNYWRNVQFVASGFGAYGLYSLGALVVSGVVLYFAPWSQMAIAVLVIYVSGAVWWSRTR